MARLPPVEMKSLVRKVVERVAADRIEIRLNRAKIATVDVMAVVASEF
jgi:hypothetical protein